MEKPMLFLRHTAIAAVLIGGIGAVHAQDLVPEGPIRFQGHIVVDISEIGPPITEFSCKIEGQGRIANNNAGIIMVESVQALNHAGNFTSPLCSTVNMFDLPWTLAVTNGTDVVLSGVKFDSPAVIGGGCEGEIVGSWHQDGASIGALAPSFSVMRVDARTAMLPASPTCYIQKMLIKLERPMAPVQ